MIRAGGVRSLRYAWLALFVDVITVAALTLIWLVRVAAVRGPADQKALINKN